MRGGFQYVNHTADIGLRVWGENLNHIFIYAAKGMTSLIVDVSQIKSNLKRKIRFESKSVEDLLLKWLRELLYLIETEGHIFSDFHIDVKLHTDVNAKITIHVIKE